MYGSHTISRVAYPSRLASWCRFVFGWVCLFVAFSEALGWEFGSCGVLVSHLSSYQEVTDGWSDWWDANSVQPNPNDARDIWQYEVLNGGSPDYLPLAYGVLSNSIVPFNYSYFLPWSTNDLHRLISMPLVSCGSGFVSMPDNWAFNEPEWILLRDWASSVHVSKSEFEEGPFLEYQISDNIDVRSRQYGSFSNRYSISFELYQGRIVASLPIYPVWYAPRYQYYFVTLQDLEYICGDYMPDLLARDYDYLRWGPGGGWSLVFPSVLHPERYRDFIKYRRTTVRFSSPQMSPTD